MIVSLQDALSSFKKAVDIPLKDVEQINLWRSYLKQIPENTLTKSKDPLLKKAYLLQETFHNPSISRLFQKILRPQMLEILKDHEEKLRSESACLKMLESLFGSDERRQCDFLEYLKLHLQKEKNIAKSLSYMIARSMIGSEEFEEDPRFAPYKCPIRGDLIQSQPVYSTSQTTSQGIPCQLYHEEELTRAIGMHRKDPCTRKPKTLKDIREYKSGRDTVRKIEAELRYKIEEGSNSDVISLSLPLQSFFLAAGLGYGLAKEIYENVKAESMDFEEASKKAEEVIAFSIELFEPYLREVTDEDVSLFVWNSQKKQKNEEISYAQRIPSPLWLSQESTSRESEIEKELEFMKECLKFCYKSPPIDLKASFEISLQKYLNLYQKAKEELDLGASEEAAFFLKLRENVLSSSKETVDELLENMRKTAKRERESQDSQENPLSKMQKTFRY